MGRFSHLDGAGDVRLLPAKNYLSSNCDPVEKVVDEAHVVDERVYVTGDQHQQGGDALGGGGGSREKHISDQKGVWRLNHAATSGRWCHFIKDVSKWRVYNLPLDTQAIANTVIARKFFLSAGVIIKIFSVAWAPTTQDRFWL